MSKSKIEPTPPALGSQHPGMSTDSGREPIDEMLDSEFLASIGWEVHRLPGSRGWNFPAALLWDDFPQLLYDRLPSLNVFREHEGGYTASDSVKKAILSIQKLTSLKYPDRSLVAPDGPIVSMFAVLHNGFLETTFFIPGLRNIVEVERIAIIATLATKNQLAICTIFEMTGHRCTLRLPYDLPGIAAAIEKVEPQYRQRVLRRLFLEAWPGISGFMPQDRHRTKTK